jgi:DNA segregation ATPase FtsK/SpoIIIE, S-DNA-T family
MKKSRSHSSRPWWTRLLIFFVTRILVLLVIVGLVYWQWSNITAWVSDTTTGVFQLFGWGIILALLAILVLVEIALTRPIWLLRYWNKWLGMCILLAAIWGILAFFPGYGRLEGYSQGGAIGLSIVGQPDSTIGAIRVLIVLALVLVGVFFIVPRGFAGAVAAFFAWITGRFHRRSESAGMPLPQPSSSSVLLNRAGVQEDDLKTTVYPKYKPEPKKTVPQPVYGSKNWLWNRLHPNTETPEAVAAAPAESEASLEKTAAEVPPAENENKTSGVDEKKATTASGGKTAANAKDLKQVAQEVWKKYGEDAAEKTADGWKLPPIEILDNAPEIEFSQADNMKKAKLIEDALSSYGVEGKVVQINVGPTVTQFGVEPGWDRKLKEVKEKDKNGDTQVKVEEVAKTRVKVDRITSLSNDLALALAAPSIRIEAPVPGKSVVGIEVPNTTIGTVSLRSVVESNVFQKMLSKNKLSVALGKGAGGESVVGDLTKMPHLLIAGATGSGKTVCIHSIICCFLLHCTPGDVRFIMIDPKRVELTSYNSLPHLATPVIVDTNKALLALRWLTQEMDKRYHILAAAKYRNIEAYNKSKPAEKMPFLVLVIDELADLMMTSGEEVEHTLCRLAQLARAVGIHLIVATQRPSVDVVTGLIKANFPTRISFAVTSQVDSRTILDSGGAEKLLGKGDMLYMPTEAAKPKRLQGCFVSDPETERLVYFWNNQKKEEALQLKMDDMVEAQSAQLSQEPPDPLLDQARQLLSQHEHISASFLQRHLRIGYPRAARLMEQLEEEMGDTLDNDDDPPEDEEKTD